MADKKSIESYSDSEEEYIQSRIGNVPSQWYNKEEHFGYDPKGEKVKNLQTSQITKLLEQHQNPDFWREIVDQVTGKVHKLTDDQIDLIQNIRSRAFINDDVKNGDYSYELEPSIFPMSDQPRPK